MTRSAAAVLVLLALLTSCGQELATRPAAAQSVPAPGSRPAAAILLDATSLLAVLADGTAGDHVTVGEPVDKPFAHPPESWGALVVTAEPILHLPQHVVDRTNERFLRALARILVQDVGGAASFATVPEQAQAMSRILRGLGDALVQGGEVHPLLRELGRLQAPRILVDATRERLGERRRHALRCVQQALTALLGSAHDGDPGILLRAAAESAAPPTETGLADQVPVLPRIADPLLSERGRAVVDGGNPRDLADLATRLSALAAIYRDSATMRDSAMGALWQAIHAALDEIPTFTTQIKDPDNPCFALVRSRTWQALRVESTLAVAARARRTLQRSLVQGLELGKTAATGVPVVLLVSDAVLTAAAAALDRSARSEAALDEAIHILGHTPDPDWSMASAKLMTWIRQLRAVLRRDGFAPGTVVLLGDSDVDQKLIESLKEIEDWTRQEGSWTEADRTQGFALIGAAELQELGVARSWLLTRYRPSFLRRAVFELHGDSMPPGIGATVCCEVQDGAGAWQRLSQLWGTH